MVSFGEVLQKLRNEKGLSQEAFAEEMQVSRQAVSKWELNQSYPEMNKLIEISDFFEVSLDELVRGKVEGQEENLSKQKEMTEESEIQQSRKKPFEFYKILILVALAMVMTAFRFVITNQLDRAILIFIFAIILGGASLVVKQMTSTRQK